MIHRGDSLMKWDGLITPSSPRSRLIFKPDARSASGLKAISGRRSCDFRRNPWHRRDCTHPKERCELIEQTKSNAREILSEELAEFEGWILGTRAELNLAYEKSTSFTRYLESLEAKHELVLQNRRSDGRFAIWIWDPRRREEIKARIDARRREQG